MNQQNTPFITQYDNLLCLLYVLNPRIISRKAVLYTGIVYYVLHTSAYGAWLVHLKIIHTHLTHTRIYNRSTDN
jgi:hypothetical protein